MESICSVVHYHNEKKTIYLVGFIFHKTQYKNTCILSKSNIYLHMYAN